MVCTPKKLLFSGAILGAALAASAGTIDTATPAALPTQVLPLLNVDVKQDTDEITFVNTNNDPFVYTKVYRLKHADPYEIRPYIMSAISSKRIESNETKVEAIKYADGTGMIIVSAEQYRFEPLDNGMTIDELVEVLDQPELSAQAGRKFFIYYAKYFDADTLARLIREVGIMRSDDPLELDGVDTVRADSGMNALLFFCTPISQKHIEKVLAEYDGPATEARFEYTIYELDHENDGNLGVDFQAWKNGPGNDLFAAGASYLSGWDPLIGAIGNASDMIHENHSSYLNFNPKWNSKYLDFLVTKSKAKVVTSGTINIWNKGVGTVESVTRFPVLEDQTVEETTTQNLTIVIPDPSGATPGYTVDTNVPLSSETSTGKNSAVRVAANSEFGFVMNLMPEVYGNASIVKVDMTNTNLIGFAGDGSPRTSKTALNTTLQVDNNGSTFYIGGLEKSEVVRSVNKVPFLGDIPGLGFLFSGESETMKRSQLVAVLTVVPVLPDSTVPAEFDAEKATIENKLANYGTKGKFLDENDYGFDQYVLDTDK